MVEHAETVDLIELVSRVRQEIDHYDYQSLFADAENLVGGPLSQSEIVSKLKSFREALVDPYWIEFQRKDTFEDVGSDPSTVERAVIITDDGNGYFLAYDPGRLEFMLIDRSTNGFQSIGVMGDAVGCYLAM